MHYVQNPVVYLYDLVSSPFPPGKDRLDCVQCLRKLFGHAKENSDFVITSEEKRMATIDQLMKHLNSVRTTDRCARLVLITSKWIIDDQASILMNSFSCFR